MGDLHGGAGKHVCVHGNVRRDCQECIDLVRSEEEQLLDDPTFSTTDVAADDDKMDTLVQSASLPSLASLFQRGKDAGLIGPVTHYGEKA